MICFYSQKKHRLVNRQVTKNLQYIHLTLIDILIKVSKTTISWHGMISPKNMKAMSVSEAKNAMTKDLNSLY